MASMPAYKILNLFVLAFVFVLFVSYQSQLLVELLEQRSGVRISVTNIINNQLTHLNHTHA